MILLTRLLCFKLFCTRIYILNRLFFSSLFISLQGDVSNHAAANTNDANKASKASAPRRSRRLSREPESSIPPNEEAEEDITRIPHRRSKRLSDVAATKAAAKQEIEEEEKKPAPTRKKSSSRVASKSKKSKPSAKRSRVFDVEEAEPPRKIPRRSIRGKKSQANESIGVCTNLCSDILTSTDFGLQRHPFDASQYTNGIASYDKENENDAQEVSNYVTDIFQRLYDSEVRHYFDVLSEYTPTK